MELFKDGRNQLRENGEVAMGDRSFRILLLGSNPKAKIDANTDTTLKSVLDNHPENARVGDVAARLQVIGNPTQPFGIRDRLYQFFVEEGSRGAVRENLGSGVLYEMSQDGEKPIAFLTRDDLTRGTNGEGMTITLPYLEGEASAPVPVATPEAQRVSIQSDADANAVPDDQEYVGGDADKGVRSDAGLDRVAVVGAELKAKPGTTAEEGLARQQTESSALAGSMLGREGSTTSAERPAPPSAAPSPAESPSPAEEDGSSSEDGEGEEQVDINTATRPTQLEELGVTALRDYARENEITVTRTDGEPGRPRLSDYAKAVGNFNRRQARQG